MDLDVSCSRMNPELRLRFSDSMTACAPTALRCSVTTIWRTPSRAARCKVISEYTKRISVPVCTFAGAGASSSGAIASATQHEMMRTRFGISGAAELELPRPF